MCKRRINTIEIVVISIFLFILKNDILAVDYFISSKGSDSADGLTAENPWKTIKKLNSVFSSLKPGDRILFRRGEIFDGTISISKSGTASNPIFIGAYGEGCKPVINGFTTLSSWNDEGNGIFSTIVNCESYPNIVSVDGINTPIGRWPDSDWMKIDSHIGHKTITDTELQSSTDWDGAEIVIRVNHWIIDRNLITEHNGTTINYLSNSGNEARDGYGYFIQNHIKTLDSFGEWYFNNLKFFMYFGKNENPNNHIVKVSCTNNLVNIFYKSYIIFDNLAFNGANSKIFDIHGSPFITIQNCSLTFSGGYGVYGADNVGVKSNKLNIKNNYFSNINTDGIHLEEEFINAIIRENVLQNIGTIPGMVGSFVDKGIGVLCRADGALIEYNSIYNTGYIGIAFQGFNSIVRKNFIDTFCTVKDDGAGIYTNCQCNQDISFNIIINGKGAPGGTLDNGSEAHGIYIDDRGTNTVISENTLANNATAGIYIHNAHEIIIENNTSFNNKFQIYFVHDRISPDDPIRNISMKNNLFFSKKRTQSTLNFATANDDIGLFGTSDYNYYVRPEGDEKTISTQIFAWGGVITYRSLPDWQSYTGQDVNSSKLPVSIVDINDDKLEQNRPDLNKVIKIEDSFFDIDINNIRFEYNASSINKVIILDSAYVDVKGKKYTSKHTLMPFTSVILMGICINN